MNSTLSFESAQDRTNYYTCYPKVGTFWYDMTEQLFIITHEDNNQWHLSAIGKLETIVIGADELMTNYICCSNEYSVKSSLKKLHERTLAYLHRSPDEIAHPYKARSSVNIDRGAPDWA